MPKPAAVLSLPRRRFLGGIAVLPLLGMPWLMAPARAQEAPVVIPAPDRDLEIAATTARAIFAGGCFWGVQGVFQRVKGVLNAVSGYSGGSAETATYDRTNRGDTGHA